MCKGGETSPPATICDSVHVRAPKITAQWKSDSNIPRRTCQLGEI